MPSAAVVALLATTVLRSSQSNDPEIPDGCVAFGLNLTLEGLCGEAKDTSNYS
jgi:hypothetical protein